jgi:hypothetical protein
MANAILYGFHNLRDLLTERVTANNFQEVNQAIDATLQEHNRQMMALLALFAEPTTEYQVRYKSPKAKRLQPLDEGGRARPTKRAGFYDVGFPIHNAGDAFGVDYVTRVKMTVQEVNDWLAETMVGDKRWMRDQLLAALFTNVNWTYPDQLYGNLTIKPLANNDTDTYQVMAGGDAGATAQHYLAQAAAIADATNPYPTIHDTLMDHPENGGEVVAFIPSGLRATTEALATFTEVLDPRITPGNATAVLSGTLGIQTPGRVLGYETSGVWIVEWRSLPTGYIIATTTEGPRPLAMREHEEAELQGFKRVAERDDHPWYESQYLRMAGFGGWNRVNGLVYRIGNASYAIPSGFAAPLP